jgi:hypothetical protein
VIIRFLLPLLFLVAAGPVWAADTPYAGLQNRPIKALSAQEIGDLRAGRGMGLALAAELNNYPGPRHALDLSDPLGLSSDQKSRISILFDEMAARAQSLGAQILDAEARLDRSFAAGDAVDAALRSMTADIAGLKGELRYVHLRYHLVVRDLLSKEQIARYGALRGYGSADGKKRPAHGRNGSRQEHGGAHGGHR